VKKLGLGGGTTSQRPLLENPIFFIKGNFLSHLLPLVFLSKSCVCSQSCACYVLKCLCALVWILDVWIISSKKILFFSFFLTFPHLFVPLCFFPSCLPCLVALSSLALLLHFVTSSPHPIAFVLLLHHLVLFRIVSLSHVVSLPHAFLLCVALLPCYFITIVLQVPLNAPICCFVTLLPHTLLHCVSLPYTLCWLVFPSSFLFSKEEFGGANSLAPRKKVILFGALFSFVCFLFSIVFLF
jgi:hypothetical protein